MYPAIFNKYFENEENLNKIFDDYKVIIDQMGEYRQQFLQNVIATPDEYDAALNFFTGAYDAFEELYEVACAYKETKEDAAALQLRNTPLAEKEKSPTDATVKINAHFKVANFIRTRNILLAYVNSCEKYMSTCQSKLKRLSMRAPGQE